MNTSYYPHEQIDTLALHGQVMSYLSDNYNYNSCTFSEKISHKLGTFVHHIKNYKNTPQATALGLISFWAAFTITYLFAAISVSTFLSYVIFALFFIIYTNLTFKAVSSLIKEAMINNIFGV